MRAQPQGAQFASPKAMLMVAAMIRVGMIVAGITVTGLLTFLSHQATQTPAPPAAPSQTPPPSSPLDPMLLNAIAAGLFVFSVIGAFLISRILTGVTAKRIDRDAPDDSILMMGYFRSTVIVGALLEGSMMFAAVAIFLTEPSAVLVIPALCVLALIFTFPRNGAYRAFRRRVTGESVFDIVNPQTVRER